MESAKVGPAALRAQRAAFRDRTRRIGWIALVLVALTGCGSRGPRQAMPRPSLPAEEVGASPPTAKQILAAATPAAASPKATAPLIASPSAPRSTSAAPPKAAVSNKNATAPAAAVTGQTDEPVATAPADWQPPPEARARPRDVTQWQPADFRSARDNRDPALLRAVAWLAETSPGDVSAGQLFAELLEFKPTHAERPVVLDPEADVAPTVASAQAFPALVPVVLEALASNRSTAAEKALSRALLGKLPADVDQRALLGHTLTALAKHPSAEHNQLLLRVVETPEKFRAAGYPDHTAEVVFREVVRALGLSASADLRARLAALVAAANLPPARSRELQSLVAGPEVENLRAGLILYRAALGDTGARAAYERRVQLYSAQALSDLMGLAPADGTGAQLVSLASSGTNSETSRDRAALSVARQLWTPACGEALARRLAASEDLSKESDVVLCAMSLPVDTVRQELFRALERRWEEGRARVVGGMSGDLKAIRDPATLIALKSLPRFEEDLKPSKRSRRVVARRGRTTRAKVNPAVQAKAAERAAKWELTKLSAELAVEFNRRFYAAAQTRPLPATSFSEIAGGEGTDEMDVGGASAAEQEPPDELDDAQSPSFSADLDEGDPDTVPAIAAGQRVRGVPFPLHKDAEVRAEYHLEWPQDLADRLPGTPISPLVVHYLRIDAKGRFSAVHGYYKRQLSDSISRYLERGKWLDQFERDSASGLCTSTDVMVTGTDYVRAAAKAPEERLVVEILIVQANDPRHD